MSTTKPPFKCPLGDPKIFCEHFKAIHRAVSEMRAENIQKDMSIAEIGTHIVFIRDMVDELLSKIRVLPTKK